MSYQELQDMIITMVLRTGLLPEKEYHSLRRKTLRWLESDSYLPVWEKFFEVTDEYREKDSIKKNRQA